MKIHFTDDEDKVFNVPRFVVRVEAENTLRLMLPKFEVWKVGVVLGAGVSFGLALFLMTALTLQAVVKAVTQ